MPSKSPKQAKFMRAVAHGWKPSRTEGPPVSVAKEYVAADKKAGKYYSGGFAENRYQMGGLIRRLLEENPEYATALRMAQQGRRYDPGGTEPTLLGGLGAAATGRKAPTEPVRHVPIKRMPGPSPRYTAAARARTESPHIERMRKHRARVRAILGQDEPVQMQGGGWLRIPRHMQPARTYGRLGTPGGLAAAMGMKTRGAPRQVPMKRPGMMHPRRGPIQAGGPSGPRPRGQLFGALQQALMQGMGRHPATGGGAPIGQTQARGPGGGRNIGRYAGPGIQGGPNVPPNLRGLFQRTRMMNRPRMGPVGGAGNRVGQRDQQGALARALQRGTGRAPMSRRYAFPGGR